MNKVEFPTWDRLGAMAPFDFHNHTTWTDGADRAVDMAHATRRQGIERMLFSEHVRTTSTYFPEFESEIRALAVDGLQILVGIEAKALDAGGTIDAAPETIRRCDIVLGSVHSPPPDESGGTGRWSGLDAKVAIDLEFRLALGIVRSSPAHVLAHPMGMAVSRFGAKPLAEIEALAKACRDHGKAFELNARYCPDPALWARVVRDAGCPVSFGSDAHRVSEAGVAWSMFRGVLE